MHNAHVVLRPYNKYSTTCCTWCRLPGKFSKREEGFQNLNIKQPAVIIISI